MHTVVLYCPWCCVTALPFTLVSYALLIVFSFHVFISLSLSLSLFLAGNTSSFPLLHLTFWTIARKIHCIHIWLKDLWRCTCVQYIGPCMYLSYFVTKASCYDCEFKINLFTCTWHVLLCVQDKCSLKTIATYKYSRAYIQCILCTFYFLLLCA